MLPRPTDAFCWKKLCLLLSRRRVFFAVLVLLTVLCLFASLFRVIPIPVHKYRPWWGVDQNVIFIAARDATPNTDDATKSPRVQLSNLPTVQGTAELPPLVKIQQYWERLPRTNDVTVVTAYFNLGKLDKRAAFKGKSAPYTPDLYRTWMSIFGKMDNDLVVFVDTNETATDFRLMRAHFPPERTKLFLVSRKDLWAFNMSQEIEAIYKQPNYPKHPPNTINPLYSCAMHAKFELVQRVVEKELYSTPFVAWIDIGLFRDEVDKNETIKLLVPDDFNRSKVAYSRVSDFRNMTADEIIRRNEVWVGGASFLATPEVAYLYCLQYRQAVRKLLDLKWMSTDQQVIYSMFQKSFALPTRVTIQLLANGWFGVGYRLLEEGRKKTTIRHNGSGLISR